MADVSFSNTSLLGFILFVQLETFISFCYTNTIFFNTAVRLAKTTNNLSTKTHFMTDTLPLYVLIAALIFEKGSPVVNVWVLLGLLILNIALIAWMRQMHVSYRFNYFFNNSIFMLLTTIMYFLPHVHSFIHFIFVLELYGVIFYFLFLSTHNFSNATLLKYKASLLFLLWNNFLTTCCLIVSCLLLIIRYGTTNFYELNLVTTHTPILYIYLIALLLKLGFPLFHFFKVELYQFFSLENIFLFSVLTTLINFVLLYFFFCQPTVHNTLVLHSVFIGTTIVLINLLLTHLKITTIFQFFAISGLVTLMTICVMFLH